MPKQMVFHWRVFSSPGIMNGMEYDCEWDDDGK